MKNNKGKQIILIVSAACVALVPIAWAGEGSPIVTDNTVQYTADCPTSCTVDVDRTTTCSGTNPSGCLGGTITMSSKPGSCGTKAGPPVLTTCE
jgi:hypothetical protein